MPGQGNNKTQQETSFWTCGSDWTIEITNNDNNGDKKIYNVHKDKLIHGKVTSGYFQRLFESATFAREHQDSTSKITLPSSEQAEAFPIFLDFLYEKENVEVKNYCYYVTLAQLGDYFEIQGLEKGSFIKQGCLACRANVKATYSIPDVTSTNSFCNLAMSTISDTAAGDLQDITSLVAFMLSDRYIIYHSEFRERIRVPISLLAAALPLVRLLSTDLLGSFKIVAQYVKGCLRRNTDEIPDKFFCTSFPSMLTQLEVVRLPTKANKLQNAEDVIEVCLNYLDLDCQYSPVDQNQSLSWSQMQIIGIMRMFRDKRDKRYKRKTMRAWLYESFDKEQLARFTRHCPSYVLLELLE